MIEGGQRHSFSFFREVQTLSLEACTSAVAPLSDDFLSQSDATSTTTSHCSKHDHAVISPGTYCLHVIPVLVVLLFCMLRLTLGQMAQGPLMICVRCSILRTYRDALSATIQKSGVRIVSSRTFVDAHGRHYVVELLLDFVFNADAEFMRH